MDLMQEAILMGFSGAAVMDTKELVFVPEYRTFCEENLCGCYNLNPACPPTSGTVEEMKQRALSYEKTLVLQTTQEDLHDPAEYKKEKLLPVQVAFIEEMENENIKRKILVLDKNNTYLSHIVALTLCALYDEKREEVSTAGIEVGNVRLEDIKAFCNRNHIPYWGKFESKKITESYTYDYIVCINMELEKNTFSKIKTIYYENIKYTYSGKQ